MREDGGRRRSGSVREVERWKERRISKMVEVGEVGG